MSSTKLHSTRSTRTFVETDLRARSMGSRSSAESISQGLEQNCGCISASGYRMPDISLALVHHALTKTLSMKRLRSTFEPARQRLPISNRPGTKRTSYRSAGRPQPGRGGPSGGGGSPLATASTSKNGDDGRVVVPAGTKNVTFITSTGLTRNSYGASSPVTT